MAKENQSWQDALGSLRASMDEPAATDEYTPEATDEVQPLASDKLTLSYERKGRGGKEATIISGFSCSDTTLLDIASKLKKTLGCGGSARGGEILIQGDRRKQLPPLLRAMGFKL